MRYVYIFFANCLMVHLVGAATTAPDTAIAQGTETEQSIQAISIHDAKDPEFKSYRRMLSGLDAFERHHQLAPAASSRFILRPQQPNVEINGVRLRVAGDDTSIDISVAVDGTFSLPRNQLLASDETAELILNRKKGLFRWRPDIRTPGVKPNARRMGDLRLECEIRWAVEMDDLPFFQRTLFQSLGGPCHSKNVFVQYQAPKKLNGVTLESGARRESINADRLGKNGGFFSPPLHDQSWPDDTIIAFQFEDAL